MGNRDKLTQAEVDIFVKSGIIKNSFSLVTLAKLIDMLPDEIEDGYILSMGKISGIRGISYYLSYKKPVSQCVNNQPPVLLHLCNKCLIGCVYSALIWINESWTEIKLE